MGSLVKPVPPVRRMVDVVRHVLQRMGEIGVIGNGLIARMVTRACWKLPQAHDRARAQGAQRSRADSEALADVGLSDRHGGGLTTFDITEIPVRFRVLTAKLAICFDVWSRMPLGARVMPKEPAAIEMSASSSPTSWTVTPRP